MMRMIETYYRVLKHDPEGRLVKDTGIIPSHSYVIQLLEFIESIWTATDKNATDVDNAETVLCDVSDLFGTKFRYNAPAGDDTHGIVVGTNAGPTAEGNENYKLDTKILHSAVGAAGKMNYQAVILGTPGVVGTNVDYDISRLFLNETDATITVKEIGIIIKNTIDTKYHLILRDVVTDEPVEAGYTLTVVYTLRTTV